MIIYTFIILFQTSLLFSVPYVSNIQWIDGSTKIIISQLIRYVKDRSNKKLFKSDEFYKCIGKNNSNWTNPEYSESFYELINYSGKTIGDIGMETECSLTGIGDFFLIQYELNLSEIFKNQPLENEILTFVNISQFTTGICVYSNCSAFFKSFFDKTNN